MAAIGKEPVCLPFRKGAVGKECRRYRLEGERRAKHFRHHGLAAVIEINLYGAGAEHHVEAHAAHTRHMVQHDAIAPRSEEHTSELQSLMRLSYAVFCLKKKTYHNT